MNRNKYRPDVDGLRALAVIAVLVYHAFPAALPGGFTGVDIFFVISGYLISRIIIEQLDAGRFSFANFYARRVRRIFPALALVLATTLLFGWWALLPQDFTQLGAHVAAGAAFVANVLLWQESADYFDAAAELKPLLHLWSLGVEEQYYLLWPVLLVLAAHRRARLTGWMIVLVAAGSFAVNLVLTDWRPDAAFYLPMGRFWELMVGSAIAWLAVARPALLARFAPAPGGAANPLAEAAAWLGLALLAVGLAVATPQRFPGLQALLPTLGAGLLILAGPSTLLARRLLARRVPVFIGLISYPLYLWHWPILVYARILNEDRVPPPAVRMAALLLALLLAWATWALLESRVRHLRPARRPRLPVMALGGSVAALACCGLLVLAGMVASRSAKVAYLEEISASFSDWSYDGDERHPGSTGRTVLFIGDSHMQQFLPRIERLVAEGVPRHTVEFRTRPGCAPIPGIERHGRECHPHVVDALAFARSPEVQTVIVGASWVGFMHRTDYYRVGGDPADTLDLGRRDLAWALATLERELAALRRAGKRVFVVLSSPRGEAFDPRRMVDREGFEFHVKVRYSVPRREVEAQIAPIDGRLRALAARVGAGIIAPMDQLCTAEQCPVMDGQGRPLYKDDSHLRSSIASESFTAFDRYVKATATGPG